MKKLLINTLCFLICIVANAQTNISDILTQIEANNTRLKTLRQQVETQKIGNRTDIYLHDPEVEFNYLWGSPTEVGKRTDFAVSQSFDFPTAYGYRRKIANMENENLDLAYKSERIDILLRAKQLIIQWMYYNALGKEYDIRLQNARQIASSYQKRFDIGDANILENNKAQINLTNVENERKKIEIEQNLLFSQLKALNGGQAADVSLMDFPLLPMSLSFEDWYAGAELKSPLLQYISKQREIAQQQVKLNNALALPKFTTGYMSEKVVGEHFQGITLGISIPLWENKNKVRQAKAQVRVAELELEDNRLQFYNHLQGLHVQAAELQRNVVKYKRALADHNNEPFLKKALDAGEISLLTYLLEIEYYYDAVEKTLEAEKDYNLAVAELSAIEL